jgi:hypothetical protein
MTAARKIAEAEAILAKMHGLSGDELRGALGDFVRTIHETFSHLLEEYNLKFGCKIDKVSLEKFKTKAKKTGNINAINFLIWYEKEYKKIRDGPAGSLLERDFSPDNTDSDIVSTCSILLDGARATSYNAYENF